MSRRPFLVLGTASFLTTLLASSLSENSMWIVWATAALLLVLGIVFRRYPAGKAALGAALAAILVMVSLFAKYMLVIKPALAYAEQTAAVTVRICDSAQTSSGPTYVVRVESGDLPKGTRLFLWAGDLGVNPRTGDLLTGNVELHAAVSAEAISTKELASSSNTWLYAWPTDGYALMWSDGRDSMPFAQKGLTVCREHIQEVLYRYLPPDYAALCESVLMGERDRLDETMCEQFRACGVYHVLAVSGLHLTVITGAALFVTRRLRKRTAALCTMAAIWMFMALCGFSPSVNRAGVMMLIVLSGRLFRRRADGLNSLGFAAFVMLLADPLCGYDVGWQLSFAATLGLLTALPVWQREVTAKAVGAWLRLARPLSSALSAVGVTVCASWATMPLLAWYFGEISTVFLPCNLLCVPLTTVLLVLVLLGVLVAMLWPSVGVGVLVLCERLCLWLDRFTALVASAPYVTIKTMHPLVIVWLFAFTAMTAVSYILWRKRGLKRVTSAMLGVLLVGVTAFQLYDRDTVYITVVDTDAPAIIVQTKDGAGLVFAGDTASADATLAVLRCEHIRELAWVVWADTADTRRCKATFDGVAIERLLYEGDFAPLDTPCIALLDNASMPLSEAVTLSTACDAYCLSAEGTTVVIYCADTDSAKALAAWGEADILVLSGKLSADDEFPASDVVVVSGSRYTLEDNKAALDARFETVYYTAEQDAISFRLRQNGKLSLRAY